MIYYIDYLEVTHNEFVKAFKDNINESMTNNVDTIAHLDMVLDMMNIHVVDRYKELEQIQGTVSYDYEKYVSTILYMVLLQGKAININNLAFKIEGGLL